MATKQKQGTDKKKQTMPAKSTVTSKAKSLKKDSLPTSTETNSPKKSTLHPNFREISVEMTDGTVFQTYSTYHNNSLKLDIDVKTHPAWTKDANYVNTKASAVAKFNNKFSGLSFIKKS